MNAGESPKPENLVLWLRLAFAHGLGPATAAKALALVNGIERLFSLGRRDLRDIVGLREAHADELLSSKNLEDAEHEIEVARRLGIQILSPDSDAYPTNLRAFASPPVVIYVKGQLRCEDALALAVVGPRKPSEYGRTMTGQIVPPLCARGLTIISGLAYGIDAEAHRAAVECGGRTLGVLAHGLDIAPSPASNRKLAEGIVDRNLGALVSITRFGVGSEPGSFPRRNEIIAGLSLATLVIEASAESGSLITATHTLDLNRPVMACPGDATRSSAVGSNRLIADGAALVQNSDDVIRAMAGELELARRQLGFTPSASETAAAEGSIHASGRRKSYQPQSPLETKILDALGLEHRTIDYLLGECAQDGFVHGEIIQALLQLELNAAVRQLPGRIYCLMSE